MSSWIDLHALAVKQSIDARASLRVWEDSRGDQQAHEALVCRRLLGRLGEMIDDLETGLLYGEGDTKGLSEKEFQRRRGMLQELQDQKKEMSRILSTGRPKHSVVFLGDQKKDYSNISTPELGKMQQQEVRIQDDMLDELGGSLVKQRHIGEQIAVEADESTSLIRDIKVCISSFVGCFLLQLCPKGQNRHKHDGCEQRDAKN